MIRFGDNSMSSATGHNHGMELPNEGIKRAIELERAHKEYGVTGDENFLKRSDSVPDGPTIVHTLGNSNKWEYGVSPNDNIKIADNANNANNANNKKGGRNNKSKRRKIRKGKKSKKRRFRKTSRRRR